MQVYSDANRYIINIEEHTVSNDTVQEIIDTDFWHFIRSNICMMCHPDSNDMEIEEFIEQHLNPDQREVIYEYIRKNMEMLSDRFFGIPQIKSANV